MKTISIVATLALLLIAQCVQQSSTQVRVNVSGANCSVCHGADSAFVMASGLHQLHGTPAVYGGSGCDDCHPDNSVTHSVIDGIVKMKDSTTLTTTTVCNQCHGNGAARAKTYWKRPVGSWLSEGGFCESCHDGLSIVKSRPAPNAVARYVVSGHGNTTGYVQTRHGKPGPGYACVKCHDPAGPGHFDGVSGSQMLRIDNSGSGLCLDCHAVGQSVPGLLGVNAFSKATKHSSSVTGHYNYSYECDICHDPHGTTNLAMVRGSIDGGLGAGPVSFAFTDSTLFDPSYKDSLSNPVVVNGVCNACHAPGLPAHNNTAHPGNHYTGSACWSCHFHTVSFDTVGFLSYILIDPNPAELNVHGSLQLTVQGITNLNGTISFTSPPVWTSNNPSVVTVNALGNLNGISAGTATVYVRYSGFADSAAVQVDP
jgi:Bacterial Ig-like domain (group 2)